MMQYLRALSIVLALGVTSLAQQPSAGHGGPTSPKRAPQAKTQAEYSDYTTAAAIHGGAAAENAANDFATKFPQSELMEYLYLNALKAYQAENNHGKILAMGEKVLALDPGNLIALVLTSTVLADSLSDADQDRAQKIAEIQKNSTRALQDINSSFTPPASTTPEQIAAYKSTIESMAHSALGIMELKTGDNPSAERDLTAATTLNTTQPDPYIWYHLALAQDREAKYSEALASVQQALRYSASNPDLAKLAADEQERLRQLIERSKLGTATQDRR